MVIRYILLLPDICLEANIDLSGKDHLLQKSKIQYDTVFIELAT